MSNNIEVVERSLDAINRSDFDAVAAISTEDFELDFSNSIAPMSGIYRGRDGLKEFLASFSEVWAAMHFESEEMIELDADRILMVAAVRARGHGSGIDVAASGALIWTVRGAEVAAVKMYQSKEDALEAVSAES
jgi:ketosteroid isomerase-like protein